MEPEVARQQVQRLVRQVPFRQFVITFENGDRALIEHPENLAFVPSVNGERDLPTDLDIVTKGLRLYTSFDSVTTVAARDSGQVAAN